MKLKVWSIFAMLCIALPAFISCGDDDDDDPVNISDVTGTYSGTLQATVMNIDCPMEGEYQLVVVPQKGDNDEVTVILPECTFSTPQMPGAQLIPAVTVPDVDVDAYGNSYTIEEDDFMVVSDGVTYTGSIKGTITGKVANITYRMNPGKMPMQINFTFNGTK